MEQIQNEKELKPVPGERPKPVFLITDSSLLNHSFSGLIFSIPNCVFN